jgi:hypothetical protein
VFLEVKQSHWSEEPYYQLQGRSDSLLCYGQTYAGRFLLVVAVVDSPGIAFVVTAREMTRAEKKTFQREAR